MLEANSSWDIWVIWSCAEKFWDKFTCAHSCWTNRIFRLNVKLNYSVNCIVFIISASIPTPPPHPTRPPLSVNMFFGYLPFLLWLHHLSSPVMAVHLSPTVLFMSGVGAFSTMSAANRKADRLRENSWGWGVGGVIWKDRPSHYHHAYRESSTAPGVQQSDKPPTQPSATVRPHSLQWMAQTRHSTWLSFPLPPL